MNGFALGLGLKRRLRGTRKWAIKPSRLPEEAGSVFTFITYLQATDNLLTHVFLNYTPTRVALYSTTPLKPAGAIVLLLDKKGVIRAPAAQNFATPGSRSSLVTSSSRGTQRAGFGVGNAVIRRLH